MIYPEEPALKDPLPTEPFPYLRIENGYIHLCLSPAQSATLARACWSASQKSDTIEVEHWRTFAALFHACAIAGYAQGHRYPEHEAIVTDEIKMEGNGHVQRR